ncbi:helix-turn-helix domain-containing protein [Microcystis elabens FACHB-917]|nr:helix-turn-helix domain-containing protein [Microcystis elabens FACHB-917]
MTRHYQELRGLVRSSEALGGITVGSISQAACGEALRRLTIEPDPPSSSSDHQLLEASRQDNDRAALLCLRCRVSHPLEAKIRGLHRQYGQHYGLDLLAMAGMALDDDGRLLPYADNATAGPPGFIPFTLQVVRSFKPGFCGLPHWARVRLQAHNDLKAYLRQHGLLLISDWALLADTSPTLLRQAWECFGQGTSSADQAVALHGHYQAHYRGAMDSHRAATGRASGWQPDAAFLRRIAPHLTPAVCFEQLQAMARAVRMVKTGQWQRSTQLLDDLQEGIADPASLRAPEDPAEDSELTKRINAALERAMAAYLPAVLRNGARDGPLLDCLWRCYAEGLSNRPMAQRCGCAPGTVSKKLRLEMHTTAIATAAALELKRHSAFAEVGRSVEGAERLLQALRNHLLESEREGKRAPLRRWVQQHLNPP